MTRIARTFSSVLLALLLASTHSAAVFAQPPIWEAQLGTTLPGQALDTVDNGTVDLTFGTMSFPFNGATYTGADILNISSNGFISLGGDNGTGCFNFDCSGDPAGLVGDPFPRIAPFWIDLDPGNQGGDIYYNTFNDDNDPEIDRIVITFSTGFNECTDLVSVCFLHAQVQLLEDGRIIFGYNGIGITDSLTTDLLVGISPGGGVPDPGSIDLIAASQLPFDSGTEPTIYELFSPAYPGAEDLGDLNFIFRPNGSGGFILSETMLDPPVSMQPPVWESGIGVPSNAVGPFFNLLGLDDADDATMGLTFGALEFSFPFNGVTYTGNDLLFISSNGFISLGGDNGSGCFDNDCSGDPQQLVGELFPRIVPLWTDLDPEAAGGEIYVNSFNDDADPESDRIVITFATGFFDCINEECSALVQVQLEEDGTIIFGYNGIRQTNSQTSDILVGVSPANSATDPGSTNFNAAPSINSGTEPTVYELFLAASPPPIDLDGGNVVFEPNGQGGYVVTTPGIPGAGADPGRGGGGGGGGFGCTTGTAASVDPIWLVFLLVAGVGYLRRHKVHLTEHKMRKAA
ncbi:MAG: hypothetical protein JSU75_12530 [Gammaproteobacteria bacterium]|nr:MAG: hypothetical protein JSU75_12530 [Gammaproteobacteria bacterium]